MGKYKFQFDPETLEYKKVEFDLKTSIYKYFLPRFAASMIIGVLLFTISSFLFPLPND